MSELHAAVGLSRWSGSTTTWPSRRELADRYREALAGLPGVTPQEVDPRDESTYKDFTVVVDERSSGSTATPWPWR